MGHIAANFDKHMKKALDKSVHKLTWKTGWRTEGLPWRVDLAGLEGGENGVPRVLIEAELRKDDAAANVIKIWAWAATEKNTQRILFVHGFSKHYWKKKIRVRKGAEFVGEGMAQAGLRIEYRPIKIRYRNKNGKFIFYAPRASAKAGAGRLRQAAQGLAKDVARLIHSTLPSIGN
jgi:hypothetical protein